MKMIKRICSIACVAISLSLNAQLNIDSIGHIDYSTLHGGELNDVWGYVDEGGNEYGLVGSTIGTSVVDLSDPSNPTEIFWEPGMESTWRDLKTFGDYAYVTTEALNGLLIIDLSPLPGSPITTTNYYFGPTGSEWQSAHNLYVDSAGYAYIFGANRGNGGAIILDLNGDPMNPVEIGEFDNWYVHDGFVHGDTMYLAHINDGFISILDISDRTNPVLLGTHDTPSAFSHNIWPTADGQYAFTTDELPFSYIGAYDVSDPANIVEVDRIQSSPGKGVIPHNTHVLGDYIVTSHYADGIVIHDVTYPYNMVEIGEYDTYPLQTTGYDGCWGAFPYLPSGLVLATDITEGFFVLSPTYVQAAYLEGTVTDANTTNPIDQVSVEIAGDEYTDYSNSIGFYATGIVSGGTYDVTYSKVGYYPQTHTLTLTNGVVTTHDVQLVPIPPYSLTVMVLEAGTNNPIPGADIRLDAALLSHDGQSNGLGEENFTLYYEENYNVTVGHWGHVTKCFVQNIDQNTGSLTIHLDPGIYDDFTFDFNWTVVGNAQTGMWERGVPFGTDGNAAPGADVGYDCGTMAFVTGNESTPNPDADDVDGGNTRLISPIIDMSGMSDPYVHYARWFYTQFGPNPPDDTLRVMVSNGLEIVEIDAVGEDVPNFGQWVPRMIRLSDFITPTATMQFHFRTSDNDPDINITEAALDIFFITEGVASLEEFTEEKLSAYPNPTTGILHVKGVSEPTEFILLNMNGQIIERGELNAQNSTINLEGVVPGIYLLKVKDQMIRVMKAN